MDHGLILIIDCGAQYRQLIARRVREHQVYCEIMPDSVSAQEVRRRNPVGIIVSGGPASVHDVEAPRIDPAIYELGVPVLGICYGMQLMALQLHGEVTRTPRKEYGRVHLEVRDERGILAGLGGQAECWMSHGDTVRTPPPGFEVLATSVNAPVAAMGDHVRKLYGVQFHPEVVHTPRGHEIIGHFLFEVCKVRPTWTMSSFIDRAVEDISVQAGKDGRVLCGLSGGVDSSVTAALIHQAIGDRLTCVFVDHGLLRKDEAGFVCETFSRFKDLDFIHVDARDRFVSKLTGVVDPEQKRKIIGEQFIRVFEQEAARLGRIDFLAQGTLYPDVIESGTSSAALIKSHHNVGGLPEDMELDLIEPLRELFKDEVRELGLQLGLPRELVHRQPFPGPGLAVRIVGEVTAEKLNILREADAIVTGEIQRSGMDSDLWQWFAVLLSVKTVGVMGDERSYAYPVVIRAVSSMDGMTADWARLPAQLLETMSLRIINEVAQVNRVVLDITSKPPGTIEWE